jgi:glutathione S-transferase
MARRLYDLAGADPDVRFSPYCWRTRMALAHKNLAVETVPWCFTDKGTIAFSGQGRVPVLVDGDGTAADKVISDSWAIAEYLEDAYPDRPSLFGGASSRATARFINAWADTIQVPGMARLVVGDIIHCLDAKDRDYFRTSREQRFGMSLEALCADRGKHVAPFRQSLQPLRVMLATQPYVGGATASYADYIIFGAFQWARCVSAFALLEAGDPVAAWQGRLLDAFDGLARNAPRAVG